MPLPDIDLKNRDNRADNILLPKPQAGFGVNNATYFDMLINANKQGQQQPASPVVGDVNVQPEHPAVALPEVPQDNQQINSPVDNNNFGNNVDITGLQENASNANEQYLSDLSQILTKEPPRPQYDKNREKRLETMASANAIGKALATLGDAFAVKKGALVSPRQFASNPYVAQIMNDVAQYRDKMDNYEYNKFKQNIQNAMMMSKAKSDVANSQLEMGQQQLENQLAKERLDLEKSREGRLNKAQDLESEYQKWRIENEKADNKLARDKFAAEMGIDKDKLEETIRHNKEIENTNLIRAVRTGQSSGDSYPVYDTQGKKLGTVDKGQMDKMFAIIQEKIPIGEDLQMLKSQFGEGITSAHKSFIVSKYIDKLPELKKFLPEGVEPQGGSPAQTEGESQDSTGGFDYNSLF